MLFGRSGCNLPASFGVYLIQEHSFLACKDCSVSQSVFT